MNVRSVNSSLERAESMLVSRSRISKESLPGSRESSKRHPLRMTPRSLEDESALADRRTIVLAPTGRDSDLIAGLLQRAALPFHKTASIAELAGEIHRGAGAAIVSEEALSGSVIPEVLQVLNEQPSWSDFPLILLTVGGQVTAQSERLRELRRPLGNVFLLERPIRPETLLGTLEIALRGRQRQYQIRDQLLQYERAQEALRQSEKLAVTGRLAASIAHEINNPLEAVTNLFYLARTTPSLADREKYLLEAEKELARVSHITNQTLMFNRQPTGPLPTDVAGVLDSVLSLYQGRLRNSNVLIRKDFAEVPRLIASEGELRQLFANLIGNSLDAMRGGGKLTLRLRKTQTNGRSAGIRVIVADNGYGIPHSIKARVFEPFVSTKGNT